MTGTIFELKACLPRVRCGSTTNDGWKSPTVRSVPAAKQGNVPRERLVAALLRRHYERLFVSAARGRWGGQGHPTGYVLTAALLGLAAITLPASASEGVSPTLNAPPPEGAVVLFDGTGVDLWASQKAKEWETSDGPADDWKMIEGECMEAVPDAGSIITKQKFGSCTLHLEFKTLGPVNSGVYLQTRYEVGIKDSFGQTEGAPCGAPGNFSGPNTPVHIENVAAPPLQWQTLDIVFRAPRFNQDGTEKAENARITVALNGVQLYKDVEITAVKGAAKRLGEAPTGPLMLQEHGAPIQFRNIWIVEESE